MSKRKHDETSQGTENNENTQPNKKPRLIAEEAENSSSDIDEQISNESADSEVTVKIEPGLLDELEASQNNNSNNVNLKQNHNVAAENVNNTNHEDNIEKLFLDIKKIRKLTPESDNFFSNLLKEIKNINSAAKYLEVAQKCLDLYTNVKNNYKYDACSWNLIFCQINEVALKVLSEQAFVNIQKEERIIINNIKEKIAKNIESFRFQLLSLRDYIKNSEANAEEKTKILTDFIYFNICTKINSSSSKHYFSSIYQLIEFNKFINEILDEVIDDKRLLIMIIAIYSNVHFMYNKAFFSSKIAENELKNERLDNLFLRYFDSLNNIDEIKGFYAWFIIQKAINNPKYGDISFTKILSNLNDDSHFKALLDYTVNSFFKLNPYYPITAVNFEILKDLKLSMNKILGKNKEDLQFILQYTFILAATEEHTENVIKFIKENNHKEFYDNSNKNELFKLYLHGIMTNIGVKFTPEMLRILSCNGGIFKFLADNQDVNFKYYNETIRGFLNKSYKDFAPFNKENNGPLYNPANYPINNSVPKNNIPQNNPVISQTNIRIIKIHAAIKLISSSLREIKNSANRKHNKDNKVHLKASYNMFKDQVMEIITNIDTSDPQWKVKMINDNDFYNKLQSLANKVHQYILGNKNYACKNGDVFYRIWLPNFTKQLFNDEQVRLKASDNYKTKMVYDELNQNLAYLSEQITNKKPNQNNVNNNQQTPAVGVLNNNNQQAPAVEGHRASVTNNATQSQNNNNSIRAAVTKTEPNQAEVKDENVVQIGNKVIHIKPDPSNEQNPPGSPRSL